MSWTGDGAATTVGHGLTKAPEFIIVKNRELVSPYAVYHTSLADDQYLRLNEMEQHILHLQDLIVQTQLQQYFQQAMILLLQKMEMV